MEGIQSLSLSRDVSLSLLLPVSLNAKKKMSTSEGFFKKQTILSLWAVQTLAPIWSVCSNLPTSELREKCLVSRTFWTSELWVRGCGPEKSLHLGSPSQGEALNSAQEALSLSWSPALVNGAIIAGAATRACGYGGGPSQTWEGPGHAAGGWGSALVPALRSTPEMCLSLSLLLLPPNLRLPA